MACEIRPATADDQALLTEMQYEAFFVPPGAERFPRSILDEPAIRPYHVDFRSEPGDVGVVAVDDDRPIGAAWVRLVQGYGVVDDRTPELGVAVVADRRGEGVGSALLTALFGRVQRCSLSCDDRNPAIRLYQRLGFEVVEREGHHVVMLRDTIGHDT